MRIFLLSSRKLNQIEGKNHGKQRNNKKQRPVDLDYLIPHQANMRILQAVAKKLELPLSKVITSVYKHANTSAASIPLALADAIEHGIIKQGDLIGFSAIGAGLCWGSSLVRY
jgi:3-oxoacyl-[acyl-carrier-protein] synthase III